MARTSSIPKADILIQRDRAAALEAQSLTGQLTGRYLKKKSSGGVFPWTAALHATGEFELLDESYQFTENKPLSFPKENIEELTKTPSVNTQTNLKQFTAEDISNMSAEQMAEILLASIQTDQPIDLSGEDDAGEDDALVSDFSDTGESDDGEIVNNEPDQLDEMDEDELRGLAEVSKIKIGTMKDLDKIRNKLRKEL